MVTKISIPTANAVPSVQMAPLSLSDIGNVGQRSTSSIANISNELTKSARATDLDEVGSLLGDILVKAKELDPKSLAKPGLFSWLRGKSQQISNRFTSVSTQLEQMTSAVDAKIVHFKGRIETLKSLHESVGVDYESLGEDIIEMERRIEWMKQNRPQVDATDAMQAQQLQAWDTTISFAEKRVSDMRSSQMLAAQQGPMINMMIVNSAALTQKFNDVKYVTLPAWKNIFSIYILQMEQKKGAQMALAIDEATSQAIRRGADELNITTTMVHTALNQAAIKIEDLEYNQQKLFASLDEAKRLADEAKQRIAAERPRLEELNKQMAEKLANTSTH